MSGQVAVATTWSRALRIAALVLLLGAAQGLSAAGPEPGSDEEMVQLIAEHLGRPETLRGRFVQEKRLAGFRNPLRSEGDFLLVRGRGLAWNTTAPFPSTMLLTRRGMTTVAADGSRRTVIDATQSPASAAVMSLMLALIGGDLAALHEDFTFGPIDTHGEELRWIMRLQPRDAVLQRAIPELWLSGGAQVERVKLREAAGDMTTIDFSDLVESPAASAEEAARFD